MEFTPGERATLKAVIEEYITTGEAAGSQAVARRLGDAVSSATVRNRMARLEALGVLSQPHTSAGRVPTDTGYRYYVDQLLAPAAPDPELVRQVAALLQRHQDIEPALQLTCRLLAELTHQASLASVPNWQEERVHYLAVTALDRHQVLLLLVGSSGRISHTLVTMSPVPDRPSLQVLSRRLNERFGGARLSEITPEALAAMARGLAADPAFCRQAAQSLRACALGAKPFLCEGAANMLEHREFRDAQRMHAVMLLLDQEHPLRDLLDRATSQRSLLMIGQEFGHTALADCALVGRAYQAADGTTGAVAILGPKRMRYDLALASLNLVLGCLNRALWAAVGRP